MSGTNFAAQVDAWTKKSQARCEAVFRDSAQTLCEEVVARAPIDTGFLRHGFTVSKSAMPMIDPNARGEKGKSYSAPSVTAAITNVSLGERIYGGFVAAYAAHLEYGTSKTAARRFVGLTVQRWPQIVKASIAKAKAAVSRGR